MLLAGKDYIRAYISMNQYATIDYLLEPRNTENTACKQIASRPKLGSSM